MPRDWRGQQLTFAIDSDPDQRFDRWIWVPLRKHDTVQKIASRRGHPEDARRIADANGIRSVRHELTRAQIKVPGELAAAASFSALAGDTPPTVVGGYAKLGILDRPQRTGLSTFEGYDPITLSVPIRFEAVVEGNGVDIERDCVLLERMAGRGNFAGAAVGPPPVIRVSATDSSGAPVPVIPANYQWSPQNRTAPLWRIAGLEWDDSVPDGVLRNGAGNRIRQKAVVTIQQQTNLNPLARSAAGRAQAAA